MELTHAQQEVIQSVDTSTAILAGAGSGKTEVLTGRLLYLLKEKGLNLSQILCVTFTEKAAQEMKGRIARSVPPEVKKELPWAAIGTFHSICLGLLREQAPLLGLPPFFEVWDEAGARLEIHRACRSTLLEALARKEEAALTLIEGIEFRHALLLLEELMGFRWQWERLQLSAVPARGGSASGGSCQLSAKEGELFEATKTLYQTALKSYEERKRQREILDFQDLEILTVRLLEENKALCREVQNRFAHILVDEAQDINDCQQELLQRLWNPAKNRLCIVGDPKQSIYRFRGANVEAFRELVEKITAGGGVQIQLAENFRSRPGLLAFVNHTFRPLMNPDLYAELIPTREQDPEPALQILRLEENVGQSVRARVRLCRPEHEGYGGMGPSTERQRGWGSDPPIKIDAQARRKAEAERLAEWIGGEAAAGRAALGDFALLFQSLTEVRHYEAALRAHAIPCRIFGGRGFLSAQEVLDCLFVLKILEDPSDRLSAAGLMRSPFLGWNDPRITRLCLSAPPDFVEVIGETPEGGWLKGLAAEKENVSCAEILERAMHATGYDVLLDHLDPSGGKLSNVEQLIAMIRELETISRMGHREILEYFETLKRRNAPMAPAPAVDTTLAVVQLMTVHQAKGLEFPIVILPDLLRSRRSEPHRYLFSRKEGLGFYLRRNDSPFSDLVAGPAVQKLKELEETEELGERKRLLYVAMTRARERLVLPLHEKENASAPWHQWLKEAAATFGGKVKEMAEVKMGPAVQKTEEEVEKREPVHFEAPKRDGEIRYVTVTELERGEQTTGNRLRGENLGGEKVGNVVHAVLKNIHQMPPLSLEALIKKETFHLGLLLSERKQIDTLRMLETFLQSDLAPPWKEGRHEVPFRLRLGEAVVTGTIDYLFPTPEGWVLCDFKTDQDFRPEEYRLQMDAYALALDARGEGKVAVTRLLYLRSQKVYEEAWTPERKQRAEATLRKHLTNDRANR